MSLNKNVKQILIVLIVINVTIWNIFLLYQFFNHENNYKLKFFPAIVFQRSNDLCLKNFRFLFEKISEINLTLVALDPVVLQGLNFQDICHKPLVTFGLFKKDLSTFQKLLSTYSITHKTTKTVDYRYFKKTYHDSINITINPHYFFITQKFTLHVAIIYNRNNYFWIPELRSDFQVLKLPSPNLRFPMAFEKFECKIIKLIFNYYPMCIPANVSHYLYQLQYSKFLECPYENVVWKFYNIYVPTNFDITSRKEGLETLMKLSRDLHFPIYISFGTLLGWYRQCDYIAHSYDVDTAMFKENFTENLFKNLWRLKNLTLTKRLGTLDDGLEFRFLTDDNAYIDLFLNYKSGNVSYMFSLDRKSQYRSTFPVVEEICSADLWDLLVYLPCDPLKFIKCEYDSWFTPEYLVLPKNFKRYRNYSDEEWEFINYEYKNKSCINPNLFWGCDKQMKQLRSLSTKHE